MSHPIATPEQHEHELQALELTGHPTVRKAFDRVRDHWLAIMDPSPAMRGCFDPAFEEVMFSAAVWSSNQDPLRPKVTTITRLAHPVAGRAIPWRAAVSWRDGPHRGRAHHRQRDPHRQDSGNQHERARD